MKKNLIYIFLAFLIFIIPKTSWSVNTSFYSNCASPFNWSYYTPPGGTSGGGSISMSSNTGTVSFACSGIYAGTQSVQVAGYTMVATDITTNPKVKFVLKSNVAFTTVVNIANSSTVFALNWAGPTINIPGDNTFHTYIVDVSSNVANYSVLSNMAQVGLYYSGTTPISPTLTITTLVGGSNENIINPTPNGLSIDINYGTANSDWNWTYSAPPSGFGGGSISSSVDATSFNLACTGIYSGAYSVVVAGLNLVGDVPSVDLSSSCNQKVQVRLKSTAAIPLTLQLVDNLGNYKLNWSGPTISIPGDNVYRTYTFDFTGSLASGANLANVSKFELRYMGTTPISPTVSLDRIDVGDMVLATEPTTTPSSVTMSNVTSTGMTINWTNGDGSKRVVLMHTNGGMVASPLDGLTYAANSAYASGQKFYDSYTLYNGTGSSVDVTGLNSSSTYLFELYEYNEGMGACPALINYYTPSITSYTRSATTGEPTTAASSLTFTSVTGNGMSLNWTNGNGTKRMVIAKQGSTVNQFPVDFTTPNVTASSTFGSGTDLGGGNYVVYDGTGSSVNLSGLSINTTYYFAVIEYNQGSNPPVTADYLTSTYASGNKITANPATEPTVAASSITFTGVSTTSMTVNWTNGNGAGRLVVIHQGSAVSQTPIDLNSYTANATYGSGTNLGSANYVVYSSTGTSVTVTGLTASTLYYVSVFEYNGSGTNTNYFVSTYPSSSQNTSTPLPVITTGTISGSPFCGGATISVPYTVSVSTFTSGNVFTAQLSNSAGSFTTYTNIGSLTSVSSGTISATIPTSVASGSLYRIRVIGSNPSVTGSTNTSNLTITNVVPTFTVSNSYVKLGESISVSNTTSNTTACLWNFGSGATPATSTNCATSVQYSTPGAKTVSLRSTVTGGCFGTSTKQVNAFTNTPVIPTTAQVITGTQTYASGGSFIWVCSGGSFSSAGSQSDTIFVESGGVVTSPGVSSVVYLKSGASCTNVSSNSGVTYIMEPGSSAPNLGTGAHVINVTTLTYDYSKFPCGGGCLATNPITISSQPTNQSVCAGANASFSVSSSISNVSYQWQINTPTGFSNISNSGPYSNTNTATMNITGATAMMNGNQFRCVLSRATCPTTYSSTVTLNIISPIISSQPVPSINTCEGNNTTFTVAATGLGLTYQWQLNTGSGYSNISNAGVYSNATTSTLTITGASNSMNGNVYRCLITGSSCATPLNSNNAILYVYPQPVIYANPTPHGVCLGGNTTFSFGVTGAYLSYQWQKDSGSGFVNIANGGIYSGATGEVLQLTGVSSSVNNNLYRCVVSSNCSSLDITEGARLQVFLPTSIVSQPNGAVTQTGANAMFTVGATGEGLTYQWYLYNDFVGHYALPNDDIFSNVTNDTLIITGMPLSMNGDLFYCQVTGACGVVNSNMATLVVNPAPAVILNQPETQTVCQGARPIFTVNATSTAGFLSYKWQIDRGSGFVDILVGEESYVGIRSSGLLIYGADTSMNGYKFRCVLTSDTSVFSNEATLNVIPQTTITSQPSMQVTCDGNATFTIAASGAGLTYQWQVNTGSGFSNISNGGVYSNATTSELTITGATTSLNGNTYRCVLASGSSCSDTLYSNAAALSVGAPSIVTTNPTSFNICDGLYAQIYILAESATAYQWQEDSGSGFVNVVNGGNYSNANTQELLITAVDPGMENYKYRCIVNGVCTFSDTSDYAVLHVKQKPSIVSNPSPHTTIYSGTNKFFTVGASGDNLTYQWQVNSGPGTYNLANDSIFSNVNGDTLFVSDIPIEFNGYLFRCKVTGDCGIKFSEFGFLKVNPSPANIINQPGDQRICIGATATFSVTATGKNLTYQWQENTGFSGFVNLTNNGTYANVTTSTLSVYGVPYSKSGYQYRCIVTTDTSISSTVVMINVGLTSITSQPTSASICEGSNTTFSVAAVGEGLTYQWQVNSDTGFTNISNGGLYSGATTSSLVINGAAYSMNSYEYRCAMINSLCSVPTYSDNAFLHVQKTFIVSNPSDTTIYSRTNTYFAVGATGDSLTYQWQANSGLGFYNVENDSIFSNANGDTLFISNMPIGGNGLTFRCKITGNCDTIFSDTALLNVNPRIITIINQPEDVTICTEVSATFSVTASGLDLTYQWQENTGSGFVNLSNNTIYLNVTSPTLTVYGPSSNKHGNQYRCIIVSLDTSITSSVAVLNIGFAAILSNPTNRNICVGANTTFSLATIGPGLSYQWQENWGPGYVDINDGGVYSGATTSELAITGATDSMNLFHYRCVISNSVCPAAEQMISSTADLVVKPTFVYMGPSSSMNACEGSNPFFSVHVLGSSLSYEWSKDGVPLTNNGHVGGVASSTVEIANVDSSDAGIYSVKVWSATCAVDTVITSATLAVSEPIIINAGGNRTVCNDSAIVLNGIIGGSATGGVWRLYGTGTFVPSNTVLNATYLFSEAEKAAGHVTLYLASVGGCGEGRVESTSVTIAPSVTANAGSDQTICVTDSVSLSGTVDAGSTGGVWSGGTGIFSPNDSTLSVNYYPSEDEISTGNATLILTSIGGSCESFSDTIVVTINECEGGAKAAYGTWAETMYSNVSIYPNPANDVVNVYVSDVSDITGFVLYNSLGESVKKGNVQSSDIVLNLEELSGGVYHLVLKNSKGESIVKRFVKN